MRKWKLNDFPNQKIREKYQITFQTEFIKEIFAIEKIAIEKCGKTNFFFRLSYPWYKTFLSHNFDTFTENFQLQIF